MRTDPGLIAAFLTDVLEQARLQRGLSITSLAREAGLGSQSLSRKLRGLTQFRFTEIAAVCEAMNLSVTEVSRIAERRASEYLDQRFMLTVAGSQVV